MQQFEEAVEEAPTAQTPNEGENKDAEGGIAQNEPSAPIKGGQKEKQSETPESVEAQVTNGTQEQTKDAESATSSLQATPTNAYFSRDGEPIQKPDEDKADLSEPEAEQSAPSVKHEEKTHASKPSLDTKGKCGSR